MTDQEQLIEEIRERLSRLQGEGSIDPMALANEFAPGYSIAFDEVLRACIKELDAAGISRL